MSVNYLARYATELRKAQSTATRCKIRESLFESNDLSPKLNEYLTLSLSDNALTDRLPQILALLEHLTNTDEVPSLKYVLALGSNLLQDNLPPEARDNIIQLTFRVYARAKNSFWQDSTEALIYWARSVARVLRYVDDQDLLLEIEKEIFLLVKQIFSQVLQLERNQFLGEKQTKQHKSSMAGLMISEVQKILTYFFKADSHDYFSAGVAQRNVGLLINLTKAHSSNFQMMIFHGRYFTKSWISIHVVMVELYANLSTLPQVVPMIFNKTTISMLMHTVGQIAPEDSLSDHQTVQNIVAATKHAASTLYNLLEEDQIFREGPFFVQEVFSVSKMNKFLQAVLVRDKNNTFTLRLLEVLVRHMRSQGSLTNLFLYDFSQQILQICLNELKSNNYVSSDQSTPVALVICILLRFFEEAQFKGLSSVLKNSWLRMGGEGWLVYYAEQCNHCCDKVAHLASLLLDKMQHMMDHDEEGPQDDQYQDE